MAHLQQPDVGRVSTPPPPPSKAIPTDFRSSLSAWWNNSSYKEARIAEERLLRRLSMFAPSEAPPPATKGWFGSSQADTASTSASAGNSSVSNGDNLEQGVPKTTATASDLAKTSSRAGEQVVTDSRAVPPVSLPGTSLVATLRNVFIPTPDPSAAPAHPADPRLPGGADTTSSSTTSLDSQCKKRVRPHNPLKGLKAAHGKEGGKNVDYINTLEISSPEHGESKEAVVVLHGYAAALGFFFRNWESIAQSAASTSRRTFFLDWLGMGLSSRPSPSLLHSPQTASVPSRVARAEHFFISSLESWRQSVGVDKMVLVGHSLGGYLASAYAVRYPERVSGLILVSPAGVPQGPEYRKFPTTEEQAASGELSGIDAVEMAASGVEGADAGAGGGQTKKSEPVGEAKQWQSNRDVSLFRRSAQKFFIWGWDRGWSPFSLLRSMGPWGPMFVGRYSSRRFAAQAEEDVRDLHSYIWNTSVMKGSGEFCITHILAPGAHARVPIIDRIAKVKVPVTFMYGDNDWMDVQGGRDSIKLLKAAGNLKSSCHVIPKAGHHLYLDNPEATNKLLGEAIKAIPVV